MICCSEALPLRERWAQPVVRFWVAGLPRAKGSPAIMRKRKGRRAGKPFVRESDAQRAWQSLVQIRSRLAYRASGIREPKIGPIALRLVFVMPRPAKSRRALDGTTKPDIDKLQRSVLDALAGVIYHDDAQVTHVCVDKCDDRLGEGAGVHIEISLPDIEGVHVGEDRDHVRSDHDSYALAGALQPAEDRPRRV